MAGAENTLDGGAPNYRAYETLDGKYIAIGPVEPKFWARLLRQIGAEEENLLELEDRSEWPRMSERLAGIFRTRTREEWCRLLEGSDVCFAPVLSMGEAPLHPHNRERQTFVGGGGRGAAGAGAALQPHPQPDSADPGRAWRAHPGCLEGLGLQRGRAGTVAGRRSDRTQAAGAAVRTVLKRLGAAVGRSLSARRPPPTASAFACRLGFCDSPSRGE